MAGEDEIKSRAEYYQAWAALAVLGFLMLPIVGFIFGLALRIFLWAAGLKTLH